MKEIIPIKEICKSEISKRLKLRSNTFKVNKWLLRIIKTTKKNKLYELGFDKKKMFIERLYKLKEKYETLEFNVEEIKDNLYYNKNEELIKNLKDLNKKVKVKLEVKDRLFVLDQIKKSIEKRVEYMETDKKRMLNNILEREVKKINNDRLLITKENGNEELILNTKEILEETNKHYKNITDTTLIRDEFLEKYWAEEYKPKPEINEEIYKDLISEIEQEEWEQTIKYLNKNKAGGISQITYEVIQESSGKLKEILRRFFNIILKTNLLPKKWSLAVIYPIPKPGNWNLNLNKTRPITLLECPRKLFMKVLTNRLSKILSNNKYVLGENNFAALPGKSTIEPIHILNNVIEEAIENKKELWILLQDMSKAYNLVNRTNLKKAMKRIKLLTKFIDIIINSLKDRRN